MTEAPPRRSPYSMGSVPNMVRSMLAIGALVLLLVWLVPRPGQVERPAVDAVGKAQLTVADTGMALDLPAGLGDGWTPTVVSLTTMTDDVSTFTTVWMTPSGGDISLRQGVDATPGWVSAAVINGTRDGEVTLSGRTFDKYVAKGGTQVSLVGAPPAGGDLTTVVTSTATEAELASFVGALKPVEPAA